jgi:hypothetical protein
MSNVVRGLVGLLLAVLVAWAPALAADHSWLVGTHLGAEPRSGGQPQGLAGVHGRWKGHEHLTQWAADSGRIHRDQWSRQRRLHVQGPADPLDVQYSVDKKALLVRSQKTGSTSEYRKAP